MKEQYRPVTTEQRLGYLVEECGEVLAAAGKSQRWGLECVNPELPPSEQETNQQWLSRELVDLMRAILIVQADLCGDMKAAREWSETDRRQIERRFFARLQ